ncbi:MAG: MFS transporter [Pseudomonadota bacterium]
MSVSVPTRTDWGLVILLWTAGLFAAAQFGKVSLALAEYQAAYPGLAARAALIVSSVGCVGIFLGAAAGMMTARLGARRVLLAALALGAGMSLLQILLPPFPVLLASRVVEGFSHLSIVIAAPTLMARISTVRDRPVVMGLWGMFFGVSFALTAVVLPPLLLLGGIRATLLAHAAGMTLIGIALWPLLPRGVARDVSTLDWIAEHVAIYGDRRIAAPALIFFWHTLIFVAVLTFLPPFLGSEPWIAASLPLMSLIGTFGAGVLSRGVAPQRLALLSFASTIVLGALLLSVAESLRLWVALPLMLGIGAIPGASFAAIPALNHTFRNQARANGAVAQLGNIGTTGGTPLYAFFLTMDGFFAVVSLTMALSLCGSLSLLWVFRRLSGDG